MVPIGDLLQDVKLAAIRRMPKLVVLTGGEPLRQPVGPFVNMLRDAGFHVQIESNGVFAPDPELAYQLDTDPFVMLVISPKTHRIHKDVTRYADFFKYVLDSNSIDPDDGLPIKALDHPTKSRVARPPRGFSPAAIYINPCDVGDEIGNQLNLQACAKSAMRHGYIVGIQLHKLIGVP